MKNKKKNRGKILLSIFYFLHFENTFLELITNLTCMQNLKKIAQKIKAWISLENLCQLRGNVNIWCNYFVPYIKNITLGFLGSLNILFHVNNFSSVGHYRSFSNLAIFLFELAHFQRKINFNYFPGFFLKFWWSINFQSSLGSRHVVSLHIKFGPDRFNRFNVYLIQTNKHTDRTSQHIYRLTKNIILENEKRLYD